MLEHTLLAVAGPERNLLRSCSDGAQTVRDLDVVGERGRIHGTPPTAFLIALLRLRHYANDLPFRIT